MSWKRGNISKDERAYLAKNAHRPMEELSREMGRSPDFIKKFMPEVAYRPNPVEGSLSDPETFEISEELKSRENWKLLKNEFSELELKYFDEAYTRLMRQFKGDILPTEETQLFMAVKFEILMSRNLIARKRALEDIDRLEDLQRNFLGPFDGDVGLMSDSDKTFSLNLENQLQTAKAAEQSRTTEFTKLQERHDSLMKVLKATRDQRVKQIESAKTNFLGVIKMLQDRDRQDVEGRQMELARLAGEREYVRLGRPIKYDDGSMDSPILSADTVDLGPEEEEEDDG